jgi:SNF2 family DNA or RNA helicase
MLIPKQAVREFLQRERNDWSWYRELSDSELNARRDRLPVDPPIWNRLQLHQKQGVLFGIRVKKAAYWYDTGTGKTLMMLALARYLEERAKLKHMLVLVPNLVNKAEWADEIEKHTKRMTYVILDGTSEQKWAELQATDATVIVETYAGFIRLMSTLVSKRGSKKQAYAPDKDKIAAVSQLCNMIVLDESGAVGNRQSLTYRIVKKLAWAADYVFELNGTPFGRDPTPLWGQMHCLDRGEALGETLSLFRAAFFNEVPNGFGVDYEFRNSMADQLHDLLKHRSLRCTADEADLPQTVRIRKIVDLGADANAVYTKALDSLRRSRGSFQATKNEFLRMRQISSGFIGYADDETGTRAQFEFSDNPKLELLCDLMQQITPNHKVVVFNEYTFSGSMICRELTKLGIKHARIFGGTKDTAAELSRFKRDDSCRVLVLQSSAGGTGLNLQMAKYVVYFESPTSPKLRIQTEARVARQGSDHSKVFIYDLLARGAIINKDTKKSKNKRAPQKRVSHAVDMAILAMHKQGRDLLNAVLNGGETL